LKKLRRDLEDLDHDSNDAKKDEDRRFKDCATTCTAPTWPWYERDICPKCEKRDDVEPETEIFMGLREAMMGGMPVGRDDLPNVAWRALAILARRDSARMMVAGMFR